MNIGDKVQMHTCFESRRNESKIFIIDGEPRDICGTEVVAINNEDGSRKSPAFATEFLRLASGE